ncbi:MAG: hypothetical protein R3E84_19515, partial [Pseudomonadales bacterium]
LRIIGSFNSVASTQFRLEFYNNALGQEDPTGHGEAQVLLGATTVTTDGSGNATFDVVFSGVTVSADDRVSATATVIVNPGQVGVDDLAAYGSTSELALNLPAVDNVAPVLASIEGAALAYTENDPATVITANLAVSDLNDGNLASAVVQITGNYVNGEDVLTFVDQNGITGTWVAGTGTLTLSGTSSVANYQAALRSITYTNTSENPSTTTRTISFTVDDGSTSSNTQTRDITVTPVNDSPTFTGNGSVTGTEDTPYIFTWADFNVTDIDSPIDANTAIRVESLPADGSLQVYNGATWIDASVGQLVTKAGIDAGNLRFQPASNESGHDGYGVPGLGDGFNDYAQFSYAAVQGTAITVVNADAETDVLAEGNWTNPTTGWTNSGVADSGAFNPATIAYAIDHDNVLYSNGGGIQSQTLATNFDASNDYSLTLDLGWRSDGGMPTGPEFQVELWAGGTRLGFIDQTDVTLVEGELVSATLFVDGAAFVAQNGQALEIRLISTAGQSNFDNLQLTSYHRAEDISSTTATMNVDITPVNDPPVVSAIEGPALTYTENDGAVAITATLTLADVDDLNLESAVVQITANYVNGEDVLTFVDQNGITGSWDAPTGTLTLTGTATVTHGGVHRQ